MGKGIGSIGWKTNSEEGLGNQGRFHGACIAYDRSWRTDRWLVGIAWNVQIVEILRTKIASHIQGTITNAFE